MRFAMMMVIWAASSLPAVAQDSTAPRMAVPPEANAADPDADANIGDVIGAQLDAFKARDVETAWGFASQNIQRLFGSSSNFGNMVSQLYPMVWDNADARFVSQREGNGYVFQQVMIQDPNGRLHLLEYAMIKTPGGWRIDGVSILPPPDVGV